jgi:hypothetical protein
MLSPRGRHLAPCILPLRGPGARRSPLSLQEREPVGSLEPTCGAHGFAPLADKIDAPADL